MEPEQHIRSFPILLTCLFALANPLNNPFHAPVEVLVSKEIANVKPIGNDFIDPRDIACKSNYDDITTDQFKHGVDCYFKITGAITCQVDPECTAQRKQTLSRLRKALLRAMDEIVLKFKGITFFNVYKGAKHLIFGTQRLDNLTGLEIVKRATLGPFNILNGFVVLNQYQRKSPTHQNFNLMFLHAIELYANLTAAEEPTGLLANDNVCTRNAEVPYLTEMQLQSCYDHFFNSFKDRSKLHYSDSKLLSLLDSALDLVVIFMFNGRKQLPEVRIPFSGNCIGSKGFEPGSSYYGLLKTMEILKHIS